MTNKLINIEEIRKKNEIVDNAIKVLKEEFVGIDKQIDEIMDNVRTWYLYPKLQTRPLVVSIWGLSGTGKTCVVKRISELLNIEKDYVYWNFASISESSSWQIENQIEEELSNEASNRMFVYDEFQYAATINPNNGDERDNKSGLKPFWELLDSGLLHKRSDFWSVRTPFKILDYMTKINTKCRMEIKNGVWVNAQECLEGFRPYDIQKFREVFVFDVDTNKVKDEITVPNLISQENSSTCNDYEIEEDTPNVNNQDEKLLPFFIRESYLDRVISLHDTVSGHISDKIATYHKLEGMNCDEIIEFISEVYENARKGYDLKFNDSIIFVIGNLDEAYQISFDVNPDMSPDQFRKITEKISVVDIKDALKKRFRNEQIARLGNIHVIYPSFSKKNFEDIIQLSLNSYEKEVYNLTGYHLKFDDSIKKIIYDEGVYPTHGTRPIFSTVYEIVKSRLPEIIRQICNKNIKDDVSYITYSFDENNDIIFGRCYDDNNNEIYVVEFNNVKLRLKRLRDSVENDDQQALCALHESGHFVMYAKLFGKLPVKLVSRTAETDTGGFLMEDVEDYKKRISKKDMLKRIQVLLGGYVAEKIYFGEEMTIGAQDDLKEATTIASKMIRRYGMGVSPCISTYVRGCGEDPSGYYVNEDNQHYINENIKSIILQAEEDVRKTLITDEWKKMLKESALYLCENSAMSQTKMAEIYDKVADSVKLPVRSETYYRDIIENI